MRIIIVTGTPGTGKTRTAKRLAREKGYKYFDINKLIRENNLREEYDRKRQTYNVDVKKLNKLLLRIIEDEKGKKTKGIVLDSHLSHYLPPAYADLCIVTKTELKKLRNRLEKRGYSKNKVRENLDCEIFDVCLQEAREEGHKIKIINT